MFQNTCDFWESPPVRFENANSVTREEALVISILSSVEAQLLQLRCCVLQSCVPILCTVDAVISVPLWN